MFSKKTKTLPRIDQSYDINNLLLYAKIRLHNLSQILTPLCPIMTNCSHVFHKCKHGKYQWQMEYRKQWKPHQDSSNDIDDILIIGEGQTFCGLQML